MKSLRTLRCTMKMRAWKLFWHKAIVSLKFITHQRPGQGRLTIVRPKVFGGKLEICLGHEVSTSVSAKAIRQITIWYGPRCQSVTLRAPNSAVFETWWAALESAIALPNFLNVPIANMDERQATIAPVLPTRRNAMRFKRYSGLESMVEVERGKNSIDDMPMLEAKGLSSLTDIDVLVSWRTWNSLDYFATPPSTPSPLVKRGGSNDNTQGTNDDKVAASSDCDNETDSLYRDISEFWSRPSEWDVKEPQSNLNCVVTCNTPDPLKVEAPHSSSQSQEDDDVWLDEIARYVFRQKVGATQLLEHHPSNRTTDQLYPLLSNAMTLNKK